MPILSKDIKLLTLSLILRTMPKAQQSLLISHFSPEVANILTRLEQESNVDVEKLDWTPFYQSWPELQHILNDCKKEIKMQKVLKVVEEQRAKIKDYVLLKLGRKKKGAPVLLSKDVIAAIDHFLTGLEKI